jgi:hypothetical protein
MALSNPLQIPTASSHNMIDPSMQAHGKHKLHPLPLWSSGVQGSVLAYVDMLREYRVAQQALGTAAAHAARQLSSLPDTIGAAERRQRVQEAAAQIQVDSRQLAELIALRRRLLHDLPQVCCTLLSPHPCILSSQPLSSMCLVR